MDKTISFMLPIFVISLFIIKGLFDIRRSKDGIKQETNSKTNLFYWKFMRVEGFVLFIGAIVLLIIFFINFGS